MRAKTKRVSQMLAYPVNKKSANPARHVYHHFLGDRYPDGLIASLLLRINSLRHK